MSSTLPPARHDSRFARWALAGMAAGVAVFLLVFYVQLLQDSVARGAQWRYGQSTVQAVTAPEPAATVRLIGTAR